MQHTSKESNYPIASLSSFTRVFFFLSFFFFLGLCLYIRETTGKDPGGQHSGATKSFGYCVREEDDDGLYIRHIGAPVAGRLFERRFISR